MTKRKIILLFLFCCLSFLNVFSQDNGSIHGIIKDVSDNLPLAGATIAVKDLAAGTISDVEGEYRIMNIPSGRYLFVISFVGYQTQVIEADIEAGKETTLDVSLKMDALGLDEVIVSAQMRGQMAAINQQLNSDALSNVVSSDKIRELPDVNAAEAIGRLPGVSVQRNGGEASKVVIRGLSPDLTSVTINGVKMPATGTGDRSVDLSIISPELLSNIEVFKSPTADMDGDFIGGVVNLGVTKAPDKAVTEFLLYSGYNGLKNDLGNAKGSFNVSRRFWDKKVGVMVKANYEKTNRSSERLNVSWDKTNIEDGEVLVSRINITDELKQINRFGGSTQLDYQYETGFIMAQGLYSGRYTDKYTTLNTVENAARIIHVPTHSYGTTSTMQGLLSGKQRFGGFEADWRVSKSTTIGSNPYDVSLQIIQYSGVEASGMEETPEALNEKRLENFTDAQLEKYYFRPNENTHDNLQAALDLKYDFSIGHRIAGFLKFGAKITSDQRVYDHDYKQVYWYYMDQAYIDRAVANWPYQTVLTVYDKISLDNFTNPGEELAIWNGLYNIVPSIDFEKIDLWQETQEGELDPIYNEEYLKYTASERVYAAYFMTKLKIGKAITFIPGLRYESSDNYYTGHYSDIDIHGQSGKVNDLESTQKYGELLPSAHLKIKPVQWLDFRLSFAKTLARPNYNMIAPRVRLDLNDLVVYQSNPDLKYAEAWNYDASVSIYTNKTGLFSFGAFYKKFDNYFTKTTRRMSEEEAVERGYPESVYDVEEDYMNFDDSRVWGLEADIQTSFKYLPAPFNGLVLNINATRLWSETYSFTYQPYEYYDRNLRRMVFLADSSFYEKNATDLPNQVDWITNVSLGYDHRGFSVRFSLIYQAAYLTGFSSRGTSQTTEYFYSYVDSHLRFDASVSQKIGKHLVIMANASNISGESERKYTWRPAYVTSENRYGATFDLGVKYKF